MRADRNAEVLKHMVRLKKPYTMGMPWNQIKAMRNIVAHNYGSIDAEILWETIENDVPQLKAYCLDILQTLNNENR